MFDPPPDPVIRRIPRPSDPQRSGFSLVRRWVQPRRHPAACASVVASAVGGGPLTAPATPHRADGGPTVLPSTGRCRRAESCSGDPLPTRCPIADTPSGVDTGGAHAPAVDRRPAPSIPASAVANDDRAKDDDRTREVVVEHSRPDEAERTLLAIIERLTAHGIAVAGYPPAVGQGDPWTERPAPLPSPRDVEGREAALLARLLRELRGQEDYLAGRTDEQRGLEARVVADAVAAALGWPVRRTGAFAWAGTMEELGASLLAARRLIEAAVLGSAMPPWKSHADG